MKKVALCLHGYFNNRADPHSGMNGYGYICETVLDREDCDVDVFFHSWEPDKEKQLCELYQPKDFVCELQKDFLPVMEKEGVDESYFNHGFNRAASKFTACKIPSTLSFLFSRRRSLGLCSGGEYDVVITARFDLGQRDRYQKRKYHVSTMDFDPNLDMKYLYSSMWDQLNAGFADQWFFSSWENMSKLAMAYDYAFDAFKPGSDYEKAVTEGWFDSQPIDNMSSADQRQFSNEMLKDISERSVELMKYPLWQCINNHLYYKWFLREIGLYDKSRFV